MIFIAPALILMAVLFLLPLLAVIYTSLVGDSGLTLANYSEVVSRPLYFNVLKTTLAISVTATAVALAIGYPIAYYLAAQSPKRRALLIAFVLLPFWTSILVKSFAFTVLFGDQGIVNTFLRDGLGVSALDMMFNRVGVLIGMSHYLSPFMIFTILSGLLAQDPNLRRAAGVMGAPPWRAFLSITLPLSLPGVFAGTTLCVILSFGMFVTPALLGGNRDVMIANLIDFDVRQVLNWGVASSLSVVLVAITAFFTMLLSRARGARLLDEVR